MRLDFTGVQTLDLRPVPAGTYIVTVASCKPKKASTGKSMIEWSFQIEDGEHSGRKVFTNTVLTPAALWKLKGFLLGLGYNSEELEGDFDFEPADMIGLEAEAVVVQNENNGSTVNDVQRLQPIDESGSLDDEWDGTFEDGDVEELPWEVEDDASTEDEDEPEVEVEPADEDEPEIRMTKAARALADVYGLTDDDIARAKPTGRGGMYSKADILALAPEEDDE